MKNYNIDYLLKYVSYKELDTIRKRYNEYTIKDLQDERVLVDNNIRYLIKYGVKNINEVIVKDIEDLLLSDRELRMKISNYEEKMSKEDIIYMLENM